MTSGVSESSIVFNQTKNSKSINIQNTKTREIHEVTAVKTDQGKVIYSNLPEEIGVNIYHYNHDERWNNFVDVIMCLLTMQATMSGASITESNREYDENETRDTQAEI